MNASLLPPLDASVPSDIDVLQIVLDQIIRATPSTGFLGIVGIVLYLLVKKKKARR